MLKAKTDEENREAMIKTMTKEEIKKALMCCNGTYGIKKCGACPMKDVNGCYEALLKCTLDLINGQDTEITRLNKIIKAKEQLINTLNKSYKLGISEAIKGLASELWKELNDMIELYQGGIAEDNGDADQILINATCNASVTAFRMAKGAVKRMAEKYYRKEVK